MKPRGKVGLPGGCGQQGEVKKDMETGGRAFIKKPYDFPELSGIVHRIPYPSAHEETNRESG